MLNRVLSAIHTPAYVISLSIATIAAIATIVAGATWWVQGLLFGVFFVGIVLFVPRKHLFLGLLAAMVATCLVMMSAVIAALIYINPLHLCSAAVYAMACLVFTEWLALTPEPRRRRAAVRG